MTDIFYPVAVSADSYLKITSQLPKFSAMEKKFKIWGSWKLNASSQLSTRNSNGFKAANKYWSIKISKIEI